MSEKSVKVEVDWINLYSYGVDCLFWCAIGTAIGTAILAIIGLVFTEEDPSGRVNCYNGGELIYTSVAQLVDSDTYIETESGDRVLVSGDCVFRVNRNE